MVLSSPKPAAFREEELPNSLSWVSLLTSALVYKTVLRGPWLICRRGKEDVAKVGCPFTLQSQDESLQGAWSCVWPAQQPMDSVPCAFACVPSETALRTYSPVGIVHPTLPPPTKPSQDLEVGSPGKELGILPLSLL